MLFKLLSLWEGNFYVVICNCIRILGYSDFFRNTYAISKEDAVEFIRSEPVTSLFIPSVYCLAHIEMFSNELCII